MLVPEVMRAETVVRHDPQTRFQLLDAEALSTGSIRW
jgi:hypothetical protein